MEEKNAKKKTNILITILAIVVIVALVLVKHSINFSRPFFIVIHYFNITAFFCIY